MLFFILLILALASSIEVRDIVRFNETGGCGVFPGGLIGPGRMDECPGGLCSYIGFTGDVIRISSDESCAPIANFAHLVDPASFTLGYIFDEKSNTHYLTNGGGPNSAGCPTGCVIAIPDDTLVPEVFVELNLGGAPNFYSGVHIVKKKYLLVTAEVTGGVFSVNLNTKEVIFNNDPLINGVGDFASLPDGSPNPNAQIENLNLFGIPLGSNGITCDKRGKTCWTTVLNENSVVEAEFDDGVLSNYKILLPETVDGSEPRAGGFGYEGLFYDRHEILAASVFEDFDDVRNTKPANAFFIIDPDVPSVRRIDGPFGMSAGVVPGKFLNSKYDYIVSATGFESQGFWPCGNLANGGSLPCNPAPYHTPDFYNAAIIGVCLDKCD